MPWLKANRDRFDGVLVHGLWEYTGLASLIALRGHRPYMVFTHGMLDPYFKRAFRLKHLKKWLYWVPVQYWVLRAAERVLFTTELERDLARQSFWLWRWDSMVVSYGADPQMPEIQKAYSRLSMPTVLVCLPPFPSPLRPLRAPASRLLLYLGRIDQKKGCDLLVQAFAAVAPGSPDLHLIMAGPDPRGWRRELHAIAVAAGVADRVHWPGMLRGDAKMGRLRRLRRLRPPFAPGKLRHRRR